MSAALKLVHSAPTHEVGPRPFATYYYDEKASIGDWKAIGRSKTVQGAIIAATRRMLDGRAKRAGIYDENGLLLVTVSRTRAGIHVSGVF